MAGGIQVLEPANLNPTYEECLFRESVGRWGAWGGWGRWGGWGGGRWVGGWGGGRWVGG